MKKFGIAKYFTIIIFLLILFIFAVEKCEAQTLDTIIQDKYELNVKLYPHLNYNKEMFVKDGGFIGELLTHWDWGVPFEKQPDVFKNWYAKEMNVVPAIKEDKSLLYVAIGLVLLDIAINRYYHRTQYWDTHR